MWQQELTGTEKHKKKQGELDTARSTTVPDCRNGEVADERRWRRLSKMTTGNRCRLLGQKQGVRADISIQFIHIALIHNKVASAHGTEIFTRIKKNN